MSRVLKTKRIPVTFDKSHLIVIGERLYAQSMELIRELVSNAYDADATHVWITLDEYSLSVKDNGSGMDEAGLRQYFNIGSPEKRYNKKSPVFGRTRIGEFGIGKFASLSACDVFTVYTQKGDFAAELRFDKNVWDANDVWDIPIDFMEANWARGDGTTVTLERLNKQLILPDIERFLRERVPLQVSNFNVLLNGKQIEPKIVPGKKFPIRKRVFCGEIRGDILIPNLLPKNDEGKGIECYVNEVFITRQTFGFEYSHQWGANRLTGKIHADFLPITSDRGRFITDTPEYAAFEKVMKQEIQSIFKQLKVQVNMRDEKKADTVLKDALSHIRRALKKNPEFAPNVQAPIEAEKISKNEAREARLLKEREELGIANPLPTKPQIHTPFSPLSEEQNDHGSEGGTLLSDQDKSKRTPDRSSKRIRVKTLSGREVTARNMTIGKFSIVCRAEEIGEYQPPVIWDSGVIFVNRDHRLYKRFSKNAEALTLLVTELIAQEIARLRAKTPQDAFELQNQILTDAWG